MKSKLKDILFVGIIIFLVVTGINAATYLYNADEVSYDNSNSTLTSTDVQSALDELYTKCNNSTTTCPQGVICTQKTDIKCKRATALHTQTCTNTNASYNCQDAGYALNDTIIYGNTSTIEGVLTVGDAFDCDVNGDGTFDAATERFYYVSEYYDTSTKKYIDKVAVLIYYSNTAEGVASTSNNTYATQSDAQAIGTCNYSVGCNWYGPISAIKQLPTTTQWNNVSLYKNNRDILTGNNKSATLGGTLPSSFSYSGYAARLLTYQELYHGCYNQKNNIIAKGALDECNFLFENTKYSDENSYTVGVWLENPAYSDAVAAHCAAGVARDACQYDTNDFSHMGIRPAIEIPKDQILY